MNEKYLTITALTRYLKYKFEQDPNLIKVYIKTIVVVVVGVVDKVDNHMNLNKVKDINLFTKC